MKIIIEHNHSNINSHTHKNTETKILNKNGKDHQLLNLIPLKNSLNLHLHIFSRGNLITRTKAIEKICKENQTQ